MGEPHKARRELKESQCKSYALTLELVKEPKSLHQHSCVWNANPTKLQWHAMLSLALLCSMY